jgi:DNA excision repair protein ERCC-2
LKPRRRIAVRELVAHTLRTGDLDRTFSAAGRTTEAIRAHQRVQRSRPAGYEPEVRVNHLVEADALVLEISGRVDGVYMESADPASPTRPRGVEEIKTTALDPDDITDDQYPLHWGQAKAYAYMLAAAHDLSVMEVQLTYYQLETGKTREIRRRFERGDLAVFFDDMVSAYLAWAATLAAWDLTRKESVAATGFPFPSFRPGQRDMAVQVYRAIGLGAQLLIQAPTGIGKTMAALFPAIKALEGQGGEKLFYLTARTTAQGMAQGAVARLAQEGLRLKSLLLTAKDKICFTPEGACTGEGCPFARGYYDRIRAAIEEIFTTHDRFTRPVIEAHARAHRVCPFEFSLDLTLVSDLVICDYNYAFDPRVHLRRLFSEEAAAWCFLVDEAHNLVDRAREMFSAEIEKQPLLDLRRQLAGHLPGLHRALGRINAHLAKIRKRCHNAGGSLSDPEPPSDLGKLLFSFHAQAQRWLAQNIEADFREVLLDRYFEVGRFLGTLEGYDERYATLMESGGKDLRVKLFCMNPAEDMAEALTRCRSAVFFSATLMPLDYFKQLFGCKENAAALTLSSPFPKENFHLLVAPAVSTRYHHREASLGLLTRFLAAMVSTVPGNQLIFFPSYQYLEMAREPLSRACPESHLLVQSPGMTEADREGFLERFSSDSAPPVVGLAVMGGIFGEGIDLAGERLNAAVIVGVGLPGISLENDLIRDHFDQSTGHGFEYAYLYPGINRVLQAAGRVIRSETDRGTVMLLDERYATARYRSLLPGHWHPIRVTTEAQMIRQLHAFWESPARSSQEGDRQVAPTVKCPPAAASKG